MKRLIRSFLAAGCLCAAAAAVATTVEINDLKPYDNTVKDDGFWSTTNHPNAVVSRAVSASAASLDLRTFVRSDLVATSALDSRTLDVDWSSAVPVNCRASGLYILVR